MEINHKDWIKITDIIFDQQIMPVEAVFLHGYLDLMEETKDFVTDVYKKSGAKYLVLNGEGEVEFGPFGFDYLKKEFIKHGVEDQNIFGVTPGRNTKDETMGFMKFAKDKNVKNGMVISAPMFVVRAFLTNLVFIKEWGMDVKLYPITFKNINWHKKIIIRPYTFDNPEIKDESSSRLAKHAGEWGKIIQYRYLYESGDKNYSISSIKEGLEYLRNLPK